ncbi:TRAP transporter small permease [Azospirillum sp. RWY-5-1]|uniref:TRAP transporter small permease protein n=1 Tax=Azospirillum oleiclasticum TaxID=2735135 RepID=A0ABX2T6E2_9PROT|nr:TRAP transporter small permease [Azospirillum oleiclasticum]NYZ12604.1 TRAP transporter small permease [Azospirillum oleiclasticum]NYZ19764.1 TRAP transporter small permease [Azospirillum oleiclasticum]
MSSFIFQLESIVGRILLATIVLLVFFAGILRSFGHPVVWSVDVAQLLFVWTSFIGADMAMRKRNLIAVDLFVRWVPARSRALLDAALSLVILAFLLTMVVLGYELTLSNLPREFGDSGISYGFVTAAVPVGCLLLAITLAGQLIATLRSLRHEPKLVFTELRAPAPNFEETAL